MNLASKKLLCAFVCFVSATIFVLTGKADFYGWGVRCTKAGGPSKMRKRKKK